MEKKFALPWRGLIPQLFVLIIFPLTILLLVFTFGSLSMHQQAMRSLVGERDERAVRSTASALNSEINHRLATIQALALLPEANNLGELQGILDRSSYLLSGFDFGVAFFDSQGKILASHGDQAFWKRVVSGSNFPLATLLPQRDATPVISPAFQDPASGGKVNFITYRLGNTGENTSNPLFIAGAFSPETLVRETFMQAFPGDQTSVVVIGPQGEVIYQNGIQNFGETLRGHPGIQEALQGRSGTTYLKTGNDEHVVAYSPVPTAGWALVSEESWERVANPTLRTTQVAPLVLVPLLLIFLAALWFGARQVIKPLQSLEAKAASVSWGDYQEIEKPVGGITEIRHLQAELVHLTQKVRAGQQSLHNYIGAITAGQEEERRRLARELHDDTLQSLIALKQRVQLAHLTLQAHPAEKMLAELEELTEQTIDNLRRLTRALRPIYLEDLGLVAALEMLAREAGQSGEVTVHFQRQGVERRLPANVELALYRIAQEALSNIARHSEATQAYLSLQYSPDRVIMNISDNGKGFEVPKSPAEFAPAGHFGLLGLYERVELIGAKLEIRSSPGEGTQLTVQLPDAKAGSEKSDGHMRADSSLEPQDKQKV